jgi:uncharacterized protein (DUF433 family)
MIDRISISPDVCHGKPVIRGTRVLVGNILGALAGGDTIEQLQEDYPGVRREDIFVAIRSAPSPRGIYA